jgi:hypothetical protein
LQLAVEQGFVQLPEHEVASEQYAAGVFADVRRLYGALPPLRLAPAVRASLSR